MSFIDKMLDTLKMESTREMERAADRNIYPKEKEEPEEIYKDKYHYEYRERNTYRETSFSGKGIDSPEIQICMALLLYQSRKGYEINKNSEYSRYYKNRYGITNINKLHKWLYDNGYLRNATLDEALGLYKVPELKTILESLGEKKNRQKGRFNRTNKKYDFRI